MPIPDPAMQKNLVRLEAIVNRFNPTLIVFLGDSFHSQENRKYSNLSEFLYTQMKCPLTMVLGNRDILNRKLFVDAGFEIKIQDSLDKVRLLHDLDDATETMLSISGHLHPGIQNKRERQAANHASLLLFGFQFLDYAFFGESYRPFRAGTKRENRKDFLFYHP